MKSLIRPRAQVLYEVLTMDASLTLAHSAGAHEEACRPGIARVIGCRCSAAAQCAPCACSSAATPAGSLLDGEWRLQGASPDEQSFESAHGNPKTAGETAIVTSSDTLESCVLGVWVPIPCLVGGAVAFDSAADSLWACTQSSGGAAQWKQITLPQGATGATGAHREPMGSRGQGPTGAAGGSWTDRPQASEGRKVPEGMRAPNRSRWSHRCRRVPTVLLGGSSSRSASM